MKFNFCVPYSKIKILFVKLRYFNLIGVAFCGTIGHESFHHRWNVNVFETSLFYKLSSSSNEFINSFQPDAKRRVRRIEQFLFCIPRLSLGKRQFYLIEMANMRIVCLADSLISRKNECTYILFLLFSVYSPLYPCPEITVYRNKGWFSLA